MTTLELLSREDRISYADPLEGATKTKYSLALSCFGLFLYYALASKLACCTQKSPGSRQGYILFRREDRIRTPVVPNYLSIVCNSENTILTELLN